ncbi:MAG: SET domain-containing protein-lysine N-methyltransferase [Candidatus Wallbacteria bacterium]|nr:SET domain-containing protein-lysine N-methyltransferase [Candidatus Wallbacteria bacterium]
MSSNRNKPAVPLKLATSPIHGMGVFAASPIARSTAIVEYTGRRMSHREADRRHASLSPADATYLFVVDSTTVIDATIGGNLARFVNHSCAPNCVSVLRDGRVWLEALRDIAPGEELSYHYRLRIPGGLRSPEAERYVCTCTAPDCTGSLITRRR